MATLILSGRLEDGEQDSLSNILSYLEDQTDEEAIAVLHKHAHLKYLVHFNCIGCKGVSRSWPSSCNCKG